MSGGSGDAFDEPGHGGTGGGAAAQGGWWVGLPLLRAAEPGDGVQSAIGWGNRREDVMSLVRLSLLGDQAFAPTPDGALERAVYAKRRHVGQLEKLPRAEVAKPSSNFRHYLEWATAEASQDLPVGAPVVVMVHGFLFDPQCALSPDEPQETDNPHGRCYHFEVHPESDEQRHHTASWPLGLGFRKDDTTGTSGVAVAFGWKSQPGFASSIIGHFQNFYARAYEKAGEAAWVLVNALRELDKVIDGRPIDLFCHSLGSRVVVRALALMVREGEAPVPSSVRGVNLIDRIGRVVLLGGAEYVVEAQLMVRRLQAAAPETGPVFYNFVSRENDVLDKLGENFGPRTFGNTQVIGHNGLDLERTETDAWTRTHWLDLQIDSFALQRWMSENKQKTISGDRPGNVWDHWYYYTFRKNMDVYRDIFRDRDAWDIARLRGEEIPARVYHGPFSFGD